MNYFIKQDEDGRYSLINENTNQVEYNSASEQDCEYFQRYLVSGDAAVIPNTQGCCE
jgi:hypothetical protein